MKKGCWSIVALPTVLAVFASLSGAVRASDDFAIHKRVVPPGRECEASFFETLKFAHPPEGSFSAVAAPHWDLTRVGEFIAPEGVSFSDVNHGYGGIVDRKSILAQLGKREGRIFAAFAHMSHIYSIPYRQYSELHFASASNGKVVVDMAGWYAITFRESSSGCKVVKWEYRMREGE
jgi:hypothetical protein